MLRKPRSYNFPFPMAEWLERRAEEHMPPLCGFETRPG